MASTYRQSTMIVHQQEPLNAGPELETLRRSITTPQQHFFVRSHGTTPTIDTAEYRLAVGGLLSSPLQLSLDDLRHDFPIVELSSAIQCAGLRRDELLAVAPIEGELPWGGEAISNATWRGVPLRAVLAAAGFDPGAGHVEFCGLDEIQEVGKSFAYGASIELEKALSGEVLLAFEMNGEPLTPAHGFPLRVVVPGYIGARSVKWLGSIIVREDPSPNYFQSRAYKLFPPHVVAERADWDAAQTLTHLPLNTVICSPRAGEMVSAGSTTICGYALASSGATVESVELSCDGGVSWIAAPIVVRQSAWSWCFWECVIDLRPGPCQLVVRATDSTGRVQPSDLAEQWNFKGYGNHAWQRVNIMVL